MNDPITRNSINTVQKTWGSEVWMANSYENNYCGKILKINAGKSFSMHFHVNKAETFYVLSGECYLTVIDTEIGKELTTLLGTGESINIHRFVPHRIEAVVDTTIIEISTYHEDSDSHRVYR